MFINIKEDLITMKRKRFSRLLFLMLTIMITVRFTSQPKQLPVNTPGPTQKHGLFQAI